MSNGLFNKWRDKALELTFVGLIKYLLSLIFTSSLFTFVAQILTSSIGMLNQYKVIISIIVFSGTAFLFTLIYNKYFQFRPIYARMEMDYRIINKEIFYEYEDKTHLKYNIKLSLEALRNNLKCYKGRYRWSGIGNVNVTSPIKEHVYLETENTVFQHYEILFNRTLRKGELIKTELKFDLEDTQKVAGPFVSATIQEPTEKLRITLKLPHIFNVIKVVCDECSNVGGSVLESKEVDLDCNGEVIWEIKKPKLLHCYEIKWRF